MTPDEIAYEALATCPEPFVNPDNYCRRIAALIQSFGDERAQAERERIIACIQSIQAAGPLNYVSPHPQYAQACEDCITDIRALG